MITATWNPRPATSARSWRHQAAEAYARALRGLESLAVAYNLAERAISAGECSGPLASTDFEAVRAEHYRKNEATS